MPHHDIPIPLSFKPAKPEQIRAYDTRDDRLEIARLLKHLSPIRRVRFFEWVCAGTRLPHTDAPPKVGQSTYDLLQRARSCDRADEALTMDVYLCVIHMAVNYAFDLSRALAYLVLMVRNKDR